MSMSDEERKILLENNIMLKEILSILRMMNTPQSTAKDFLINYIANKMSEK